MKGHFIWAWPESSQMVLLSDSEVASKLMERHARIPITDMADLAVANFKYIPGDGPQLCLVQTLARTVNGSH